MDVTFGYMEKLLHDVTLECDPPHVRCFLTNDAGYLVAYRNLIAEFARKRVPVEALHITHKVRTIEISFYFSSLILS